MFAISVKLSLANAETVNSFNAQQLGETFQSKQEWALLSHYSSHAVPFGRNLHLTHRFTNKWDGLAKYTMHTKERNKIF